MEELVNFEPTSVVLFVGEGNFSFSNLLTEYWERNITTKKDKSNVFLQENNTKLQNIYSTCYENQPVSEFAKQNIDSLRQRGVNVYLGIDATKIFVENEEKNKLSCKSFDKIIFMFPRGKMKIKKNRDLIRDFAKNMVNYLNPKNKEAVIIISLCGGQGGTPFDPIQRSEADTWQVVKVLSSANLQLTSIGIFDIDNYIDASSESYKSYGYRGINKKFHVDKGVVHVFTQSKSISDLSLKNNLNDSVYRHHVSIESVKEDYVRKIAQLCDQTTCIGRTLKGFAQYLSKLCDYEVRIPSEPLFLATSSLHNIEREIEQLSLSKKVDEQVTLKVIVSENYEMNFEKCPLVVCVLVLCCHSIETQVKNRFCDALLNDIEKGELLFDVAKLVNCYLHEEQKLNMERFHNISHPWQKLWTDGKSLYPPTYYHCLSFWLPNANNSRSNRDKLDDELLAPVLWCCGYDTVTSCEITDIYKENHRISNTLKIGYQSYHFALSSELALNIQVHSIAKTLKTLFGIEIR